MSNWHKLTKVLYPNNLDEPNSYLDEKDRIVREWLAEKARTIAENVMRPDIRFDYRLTSAKSVLGLTEKEEVVVEKKWPCGHIDDGRIAEEYRKYMMQPIINFCPTCGLARPSEPSKREIVAEILWENSTDSSTPYPFEEMNQTSKLAWFRMADAVIKELNIGM